MELHFEEQPSIKEIKLPKKKRKRNNTSKSSFIDTSAFEFPSLDENDEVYLSSDGDEDVETSDGDEDMETLDLRSGPKLKNIKKELSPKDESLNPVVIKMEPTDNANITQQSPFMRNNGVRRSQRRKRSNRKLPKQPFMLKKPRKSVIKQRVKTSRPSTLRPTRQIFVIMR